ncbi:MAG: hypothetical protein IJE68_04025 [Clostridia bacterium]|nr:hypothetical protein [Clostridia bacterium]
MISDEIKQKLIQEKNVEFVDEINYKNKKYIKTVRLLKKGIDYIYYEIEEGKIREVENQELIAYFKKNYEVNEGSTYY